MCARNVPDYADLGGYIQTTFSYDVSRLRELEVTSPEFKELLVRLYQDMNKVAMAVNNKTSGTFPLIEVVNGEKFFPSSIDSSTKEIAQRQVFRKVINFGALPNAGAKTVAHGISLDDNVTFTHIYGVANNVPARSYLPLPYAEGLNPVGLTINGPHIQINTNVNRTAWAITYVVLEFIKT